MKKQNMSWMLLGLLVLSGCSDESAKRPTSAPPPPQVDVVTPSSMMQQETLSLPGRLQAVRTAQVRARVEGIIERRLYKEGSDIKAGEVLFEIDHKVLQANVQSAKATLMKVEADIHIAEQTHRRMKALVPEKAASKQELDQAEATLARAKADFAFAKAAVNRAEIDLGYAKVVAPIHGRIGRALVTEGALVGKGEATPLAVIEQVDPIWVNFSLSSNQYAQLRAALETQALEGKDQILLVLGNQQTYAQKGKLLFSDPAVDPITGSVGLRAEFANPDRLLLPNQFVSVVLPISDDRRVLTVPQKAVQASPQGQQMLTVSSDGKVVPKLIKTGTLLNGVWVVTDGLQGDEQVIVNGLQKARVGTTVTIAPSK